MAKGQSSKGAAKRMLYEPTDEKRFEETQPKSIPIINAPEKPNNILSSSEKKDKLKPKTVYLSEKQIKAIKLKTIESNIPEHKDDSAVIRTAIDVYLNL